MFVMVIIRNLQNLILMTKAPIVVQLKGLRALGL